MACGDFLCLIRLWFDGLLGHFLFALLAGNGQINQTELVAAIINQKENFIEGIQYALDVIDGSLSMLILTPVGIYAARDKYGKTPVCLGKKLDGGGFCASFESFPYLNLGYTDYKELGAG